MDAGGRPGLGWWWWLRQGQGRRRAGAQQQQQAAFEKALRLSALETGGGGGDDVLSWAGAQLATFTGEDDNAFLAEYLLAMDDAADVETFLVESFGDGAAREAKSFSRALKMQR